MLDDRKWGQKENPVAPKVLARAIAKAVGYAGELWFNTRYEDGAPRKVLDDRRFRQLFPDFVFIDHEEAIRRTVKYYERALAGVGKAA